MPIADAPNTGRTMARPYISTFYFQLSTFGRTMARPYISTFNFQLSTF